MADKQERKEVRQAILEDEQLNHYRRSIATLLQKWGRMVHSMVEDGNVNRYKIEQAAEAIKHTIGKAFGYLYDRAQNGVVSLELIEMHNRDLKDLESLFERKKKEIAEEIRVKKNRLTSIMEMKSRSRRCAHKKNGKRCGRITKTKRCWQHK